MGWWAILAGYIERLSTAAGLYQKRCFARLIMKSESDTMNIVPTVRSISSTFAYARCLWIDAFQTLTMVSLDRLLEPV